MQNLGDIRGFALYSLCIEWFDKVPTFLRQSCDRVKTAFLKSVIYHIFEVEIGNEPVRQSSIICPTTFGQLSDRFGFILRETDREMKLDIFYEP